MKKKINARTVLITGHFNILHPGHIRLFQYARGFAERLVIGIESDRLAGTAAHISETLRFEGVKNCSLVDQAFIFDQEVSVVIDRLRPDYVLKGREHENRFNSEEIVLRSYGGKLIFSSGDLRFSSTDLLKKELSTSDSSAIQMPSKFLDRRKISIVNLKKIIKNFSKVRVLTLGDLIVDEYIQCEPLGMSQEDPTIVVSPISKKRFVGGAGIVAAHASGLGGKSFFISVVGQDEASAFSRHELLKSGVNVCFIEDELRVTTVKQRFRSHDKTLLRVSHLQQSSISANLQDAIIDAVLGKIKSVDILIFSDFNYGVLPKRVVDEVIAVCKREGVLTAADSQSSSQIGDVARFGAVDLLFPTEREARISLQNREDGLVVIAEQLHKKSGAKTMFLKMGADGLLIHVPQTDSAACQTDQIEALNRLPRDVAGAGDALLVATSLSIATGGNVWEAGCLGSIAAAVQINRVGNTPLTADVLISSLPPQHS